MRRDCLSPPANGIREREVYDRFADFLVAAGPPDRWPGSSPARRYHLRLLAWRLGRVA